jgi:hypothetical protein
MSLSLDDYPMCFARAQNKWQSTDNARGGHCATLRRAKYDRAVFHVSRRGGQTQERQAGNGLPGLAKR